jgi:hypothetical protein
MAVAWHLAFLGKIHFPLSDRYERSTNKLFGKASHRAAFLNSTEHNGSAPLSDKSFKVCMTHER